VSRDFLTNELTWPFPGERLVEDNQMLRTGSGIAGIRTRMLLGLAAIGVLATVIALAGEPAFAKLLVGTNGVDRIVGTAKPDRIKARGGNDRVNGRQGGDRISGSKGKDRIKGARGKDRLLAGRGADKLNAADGNTDRAVEGGPGRDVCAIDRADLSVLKSCEKVRVAPGGEGNAGGKCVGAPEDKLLHAGERQAGIGPLGTDGGPPSFSPAFYAITITLKASADGLQGNQLPISIEEVCDVPKSLTNQAAQLAGGEGVAVVGDDTKVFQGGQLLQGPAATTALAGADSVTLRARLKRRATWAQDEDGNPVPTFAASRITITD
jgi:hypothetical protein